MDVGPNRPDLLGHKGIARELSASYGTPFRLPVIPHTGPVGVPPSRKSGATADAGGIEIVIEDAEACPASTGHPARRALGPVARVAEAAAESVGVRSISNVVDATN